MPGEEKETLAQEKAESSSSARSRRAAPSIDGSLAQPTDSAPEARLFNVRAVTDHVRARLILKANRATRHAAGFELGDDLFGDFLIEARRLVRSWPERARAVCLGIADFRDGRREPLSRPSTRHGPAGRTLTLRSRAETWRRSPKPRFASPRSGRLLRDPLSRQFGRLSDGLCLLIAASCPGTRDALARTSCASCWVLGPRVGTAAGSRFRLRSPQRL